jgi:hypothetical protein
MVRTHERHLKRPVGRVVARFRSLTLDWIDPDSGERYQGRVAAPEDYLAELRRIGFRASPRAELARAEHNGAELAHAEHDGAAHDGAPGQRARRPGLTSPGTIPGPTNGGAGSHPAPPAPGRRTFQVRVSPGQHPSGGRNSL